MESNAGAGAWAVASAAIQNDVDRLRLGGIEVRDPEPGSRKRPEGTVLEWEMAVLGPGAPGSVLPFLIQDKTSRTLRVPAPCDAPLPVRGVACVVLGVRNLNVAIDLFRRACDLEPPRIEKHEDFGAALAHFVGTPIILAAPLDERSWLHARLERFGECPAAFLLATPDFSQAKCLLALRESARWLGRDLAWFDEGMLGARIGVIE